MSTNNIAVIITCFNRKDKTVACLTHLFKACNSYNLIHTKSPIQLSIYLTDDGCTDGTPEAVEQICVGQDLHIIQGNGQCYWAGGMRLAWKEALKKQDLWDFYLLLNDDTTVFNNLFEELHATHQYSLSTYNKPGMYSGITCDVTNHNIITYGGKKIKDTMAKTAIDPIGENACPQAVDLTNANILLISKSVVDEIGIFHEGYIHGSADYDYSFQAKKHKIPVLLTSKICGSCEFDHISERDEIRKLSKMSLHERINYVNMPTHSDKDYFTYIKRNYPRKFIGCWILHKLRIISPTLYQTINNIRGVKGY